ncbi:MAG: MFS transporter [Microthrixaceae bacterium]
MRADRRTIWLLMAAVGTTDAGHGLVFGLLEQIRERDALSTAQLGYVSGTLFAASLVGLLVFSHLADSGGARTMLLSGLFLGAVSVAWFGLTDSLLQLVAARALGGLAMSLTLASGRSVAARLDPAHAGHHLGLVAASEVTGFIVGPGIGAVVATHLGLSVPFVGLAVLMALVGVVLVARLPDLRNPDAPVPSASAGPESHATRGWAAQRGFDLLARPSVTAAALLSLAAFVPIGAYDAVWSPYLNDLGASETFVGLSLSMYGIPLALLAGTGGRIVDRFGATRCATIGLTATAPIVLAYGLLRSYWAVAAVAVAEAVVQAIVTPGVQAAMAQAVPPERIGSGQGIAGAFGLCGAGLMATVAPALYQFEGPAVLFAGVAGVVVAVTAMSTFVTRRLRAP